MYVIRGLDRALRIALCIKIFGTDRTDKTKHEVLTAVIGYNLRAYRMVPDWFMSDGGHRRPRCPSSKLWFLSVWLLLAHYNNEIV
jgi:hypothetical protein